MKPSPPPSASSSATASPPASASSAPSASVTPPAASGDGPASAESAPSALPAAKSSASLKQLAPAVVEWERPPEGMQRGTWAAPRWAVVALGAFVVLVAAAYLVRRLRQGREA